MAPCYKCSDRKIGCHDKCEKYLKFKEYKEKIKESRSKILKYK